MFTTAIARIYNPLAILFLLLANWAILSVGLPIPRQEHGTGSDLIAGEDFLSLLMGAHNPSNRHERILIIDETTASHISTPAVPSTSARDSRSSTFTERTLNKQTNEETNRVLPSDSEITKRDEHNQTPEGTIISVRVSSSIGHSMINKHVYANEERNYEMLDEEDAETTTLQSDTLFVKQKEVAIETNETGPHQVQDQGQDQEAVASEDAPSLVAESNKSEFSVDEMEPISRDYDAPNPLPYQETVIYHNQNNNNRARSVSYSTVIQAIPSIQKAWAHPHIPGVSGVPNHNSTEGQNTPSHLHLVQSSQVDQQLQHQHNPSTIPQGPQVSQNHQQSSPSVNSAAETKDYYVTSKYNNPDYNESHDKRNYETSSSSHNYYSEPTERNWGIPEQAYHEPQKPYTPVVYAQPEQNYEVDEAVSVETNGRAHGVQPSHPRPHRPSEEHRGSKPPKKDDNQKVGYVVEGRNYRKYRVEERTSDGFIVGEYGVVRHDDGSLRGVRYTADGTISPRLIYDALMKFLSL